MRGVRRAGGARTTAPALVPLLVEHDRVVAAARVVGLREEDALTLEAVDRRRTQLWALGAITCLGVSSILLLTRAGGEASGTTRTLSADLRLQGLLVALVIGTLVYVADRERRLRVLARMLVQERALNDALSERLEEAKTLLGVAKAMNSRLPLDTILTRLAEAATALLRAERGAVFLTDGDVLRVVAVAGSAGLAVGDDLAYSAHPAGHAARTWEPVLDRGTVERPGAVHVPVLHGNQLLGVLTVDGKPRVAFGEYEQRVAMLFAEQAAFVISSIHRAESARWEEAERAALAVDRTTRVVSAAGELKDPLSSLVAVGRMLQRERLTDDERIELASVVTRQSKRMAKALEEILTIQVEQHS